MERVMRNKLAVVIFLLPSFVIFVAIVIAPIVMSFSYSLTDWDGIRDQVFIGLKNYKELLNPDFLRATGNSVWVALASVCIQLPLSLLLALTLASRVKGERFFVTVYFIPVILASVVIGLMWRRGVYDQAYGLLNILFRSLGFEKLGQTVWLGDPKMVFGAVLVPILWQYVGYHMLLFYSGINSISPDIFEAAKIDGASFWRTARSITIPLLRPILMVSTTFCVVGSMKVYDLVRVLTNSSGGPVGASDVITLNLVRTMFYPNNRYGMGSAMAIILIAECFLLYQLVGRLFRERDGAKSRRRREGRNPRG